MKHCAGPQATRALCTDVTSTTPRWPERCWGEHHTPLVSTQFPLSHNRADQPPCVQQGAVDHIINESSNTKKETEVEKALVNMSRVRKSSQKSNADMEEKDVSSSRQSGVQEKGGEVREGLWK